MALCADRAAIERVYHEHRSGTKKSFEESMPAAQIEGLVRLDLHKEAVLRAVYQVEITPEMVDAEVQRINATTRAPEMLTEIKEAMGNDSGRFARSLARPIVVERTLRARFENDDALHVPQRHAADAARAKLLTRQPVPNMAGVTWLLAARPAQENAAPSPPTPAPTHAKARSRAYSVEASAQLAQVLGSPGHADQGTVKLYLEDLHPELQTVLRAQLQKPGDVSAVIELPTAFQVFCARERTPDRLRAAVLTLPKRSYDEWLAQQPR